MKGQRGSRFKSFLSILKGEFDETHIIVTDKQGNIKDGHPLPSKLIKFRITGQDQADNSITLHGTNKTTVKMTIEKETADMINDGNGHVNGPVLKGYDDVTKKDVLVIYCLNKGGD